MMSRTKRLLALAVLSGLGLSGAAWAQNSPPMTGGKMYTNKQQFRLPFNLPKEDRQNLREVQLYVKGPNEAWACKETTPPTQTHFTFRAPVDGEYQFSIVTVDKAGRASPGDVTQEVPALVVVVDTTPPEVYVSLPPGAARSSGEDMIRVSVRESNPDATLVRAEYQTPDRGWQALAPAGAPDQFRCPAPAEWNGVVRVSVTDRAGNTTVREAGGPVQAPSGPEVTRSGPDIIQGDPNARPPVPSPIPGPVVTHFPPPTPAQTTSMRPSTPSPGPAPHGPGAAPAPVPTPRDAGAAQRAIVNGSAAQLEYKIDQLGASGVGKVEVWVTSDEGKNWQKLCEDPDRASPAEVRLPGEGVYGLCVVVTNGNGVGDPPPRPGTAPDWWVEIDSTRPSAQLLSVRQSQGDDSGNLLISWAASDKNFGPEPVDLYYASQKDGQWQQIVRGLKNDGQYRWAVPREITSEFYIRLDVTDRAGNTTRCDSPQAIVMDMSRPRARVLGVSSSVARGIPAPTPPTGN